jgi:hypothetical protein
MKFLGVLFILGVCYAVLSQTSTPTKSNAEDEVASVQKLWLEAEQRGDAAALDRILDDGFVGSGPGGNLIQKSDLVVTAPESQPRNFLNQNLADTTVKAFGNTVVVLGKIVDSNDKSHQVRFSMVYEKRANQWKMVAAQLVPVVVAQE